MKIISKRISYNDYWSKIPGIIPSLTNYWQISDLYLNCVNEDDISGKIYSQKTAYDLIEQYNIPKSDLSYSTEFKMYNLETLRDFKDANFHHIPSDIIVPNDIAYSITDYTDLYVNIPDKNGDFYDLCDEKSQYHYKYVNGRWGIYNNNVEVKILTFATFNKWYSFFNEYHKLLYNAEYDMTFTSATQSYTYLNNNILESDLERCNEMDRLYESRGGEKMYKFMNDKCVLKFYIPKEFSKKWGSDFLYYSEAVKWCKAFENEYIDNNETKIEDDDAPDCCKRKEYNDKGGYDFYMAIKEWLDGLEIRNDYVTNSASITIPLTLTRSIDDLGEMSIISDRWEPNEEFINNSVFYQPYLYDRANKDIYLDDEYYLANGSSAKTTACSVQVWNSGSSSSYTMHYIGCHSDEFSRNATEYTYSPINGRILYDKDIPADGISKTYDVTRKEFVVINSVIQDVIHGKYVTLSDSFDNRGMSDIKFINNDKLPIYDDGMLEYCVYKGRRYYVEKDGNNEDVVRFMKSVIGDKDNGCLVVNDAKYVLYTNNLHLVENDKLAITNEEGYKTEYEVLNGYFTVDDRTYYINKNNEIVLPEVNAELLDSGDTTSYTYAPIRDWEKLGFESPLELSAIGDKVTAKFTYNTRSYEYVSGYSESKLELLRIKDITTDDLGNELPGYFNFFKNKPISQLKTYGSYNTVYEGATLDILYKAGTVSDLERINDGKYFGNYLEKIELYYVDADENVVTDSNNNEYSVSIVDETMEEAVTRLGNMNFVIKYDDVTINTVPISSMGYQLMMDVTYYIGCTLIGGSGKYSVAPNTLSVKYIDSIIVNKKTSTFYTEYREPFLYNYYELKPHTKSVYNSTLRKSKVVKDSYFEMKRPLFDGNSYNGDNSISDITRYNEMRVSPVFRQEWNMFSSTPQIIENDIYIDRGINSAFEKHLKLQEIRTMEALETYGISYFNIENS